MANQMVSRFRTKKPLAIYKESQLPDLEDISNLQKATSQIETGVEKEEEEEHDLQAAINAAQTAVKTGVQMDSYIPIPDASHKIDIKDYEVLYKKNYKLPSTLIRFSSTVEDSTGCPYVMNEKDNIFLDQYNNDNHSNILTEDNFEFIMWQLESIINKQLPNISNDITQLPDYDSIQSLLPINSVLISDPAFEIVFEYWRTRKYQCSGKPIISTLAHEDLLKNETNPYVCFRRREVKFVRKTRRTDQQYLDKLILIRANMEMAKKLLGMVIERENLKKEKLNVEKEAFEKESLVRNYQRILNIQEDELPISPNKKRKVSTEGGFELSIKIPLNKLKQDESSRLSEQSALQSAIKSNIKRKRVQDEKYEDITEIPYQPFPISLPRRFFQPLFVSNSSNQNTQHHFRQRAGRNGRFYLDRRGFRTKSINTTLDKQYLNNNIPNSFEKYRFDCDSDDSNDELDNNFNLELDKLNNSCISYRSKLLTETDLRNLITIPFSTSLNTDNIQLINNQQNKSSSSQYITTTTPNTTSQSITTINSNIISQTTTLSQHTRPSNVIPNNNDNIKNINLNQTIPSTIIVKRQNNQNKVISQQSSIVNEIIINNMTTPINQTNQLTSFIAQQ